MKKTKRHLTCFAILGLLCSFWGANASAVEVNVINLTNDPIKVYGINSGFVCGWWPIAAGVVVNPASSTFSGEADVFSFNMQNNIAYLNLGIQDQTSNSSIELAITAPSTAAVLNSNSGLSATVSADDHRLYLTIMSNSEYQVLSPTVAATKSKVTNVNIGPC